MKGITKFIVNGDIIYKKLYKLSPYIEFRQENQELMSVNLKKRPFVKIPLITAIFTALLMDLLLLVPMFNYISSPAFMPTLIYIVLFNAFCFIIAIIISIYLLNSNFEFIFDKKANDFIKIKRNFKEKNQKIIFKYPLSDIREIELDSRGVGEGTRWKHQMFFKLHSGQKIKLFHTADYDQIWAYVQFLNEFLQVDFDPRNFVIRRFFSKKKNDN
jgi:hypothetical protein